MNLHTHIPTSIRNTGTNLLRAKTHNHRVVLDVVRSHGPLSRAEVARITLLSRQTIQNIVAELQEVNLVRLEKAQKKATRRGHPGVEIHFCPEGGFSLGVHLDQFSLVAVLTDLAGNTIWQDSYAVVYPDPEVTVLVLKNLIGFLKTKKPEEFKRLMYIGLAMPGPFNVTGITSVGPTTLPRWTDLHVSSWFEKELGLPVIIENDASAAAVGEHLFGIGAQFESFAYIYFGLGLGAGLHINGSLYHGMLKNAGEIGHMIVDVDGRSCPCGNRGCLERYVSLQSLYDALGIDSPEKETIHTIEKLFEEKDPRVEKWIGEAIPRLRQAINILESVLDTNSIVIGGILPPVILNRIVEELGPLHNSVGASEGHGKQRVFLGASGPNTTALGAAAIAVFAQIGPQVDMLLKK